MRILHKPLRLDDSFGGDPGKVSQGCSSPAVGSHLAAVCCWIINAVYTRSYYFRYSYYRSGLSPRCLGCDSNVNHAAAPARNLARCLGHERINTIQWMSHTFMSQQSSNSLIVWCQWLTDLKATNLMKVRHIYCAHVCNVSSPRPQLCVGISLQSGAGWPCVTSDPAVWLWLSHTGDWWRQP